VLSARIRALLRRGAHSDVAPLEVGALRLDSAARRVWCDDREVELTTREFDVLEFLLRRHGTVQSKTAVLAGVWSDEFDGDPNIVEVYIARLRRKLAAAGADDVIATLRGAGYRAGGGSS
jgi:DNA-binding response OmpR family regulator